VQEAVHDRFIQALASAVKQLKVGDGFGDGVTQGPLINSNAVKKVIILLEESNHLSRQGRPSPDAMMHFPLLQISPFYFRQIYRLCGKFSTFYLFTKKFRFSSAKISDDLFLVIDHIFRIPLYFPVSVHFPLVPRKLLFPPTLKNFPPVFEQFTCFLRTLRVFRFPPTLTMMHLCITQCTYWTPLIV